MISLRPRAGVFVRLTILVALAAPADAACLTGTKCITAPKSAYTAPHAVGDRLEPGTFTVLLNTRYHGLPRSDGSFWYVQVDRHVYRMDSRTYEVLDDVTWDARRLPR